MEVRPTPIAEIKEVIAINDFMLFLLSPRAFYHVTETGKALFLSCPIFRPAFTLNRGQLRTGFSAHRFAGFLLWLCAVTRSIEQVCELGFEHADLATNVYGIGQGG